MQLGGDLKQHAMPCAEICLHCLQDLPADDVHLAAKGHSKLDSHVAQTTQANLQQQQQPGRRVLAQTPQTNATPKLSACPVRDPLRVRT
jgi:hypothetical protein